MNVDKTLMRHRREFGRAIANKQFEVSPGGILFPKIGASEGGAFVGGVFEGEHRRYASTPSRAHMRRFARLPLVGRHFRAMRLRHQGEGELIERFAGPNIIPTQGLNHILDVIAHGVTAVNPWYVALYNGATVPGAGLTGANFAATQTEFTGYDETTRVAFNEGAAAAGVIDNAASRAVFTCNASATVRGGALLSASAKGANGAGDVLLACAAFPSSRAVVDDDELAVKYTLTLTSG